MESKPSDVLRAAIVEWETSSDADKGPYMEKAAKLKAEYLKSLKEYREFRFANYTAKQDAIKAKSEEVAEEIGMNLTGLIIRQ